jgi:hypothetical protein
MRLARGSTSRAQSPYRTTDEVAPPGSESPVEPSVVGVLLFVFGCSSLRVALFVCRADHFGVEPMLALGAAAAFAYHLARALIR